MLDLHISLNVKSPGVLSHYICLVVQVGEGEKRGEERSSSEYGLKDMFHPTLRYIREPSLKYKINK